MGKLDLKFHKILGILLLILMNYAYSQEELNNTQNTDTEKNITYSAQDSIIYDIKNNQVFLYKNAELIYKNIKLESGFMLINFNQNTVFSTGLYDSLKNYIQKPVLTEDNKTYNADTIRYNYKSKKAKIKKLLTEEDGGYLHGKEIKKADEKVYYLKNGKYTTCSLEDPHFFINAKKLKLIPGEKIITGPANLVLGDIPSPLSIPFGIFPTQNKKSSGIILPTYGRSENLGYYLIGLGYYLNINDNMGLSINGDIYSRGSSRIGILFPYKKRYKFDGNLTVNIAKTKIGEIEREDYSLSKDFKIQWTHKQNPKAHPNNQFSASVNLATSSYMRNNSYNATDYLTNTLASNISFQRRWDNKPYNLSINLRHAQNTLNKQVDLTLPELSFSVNRIFPFKKTLKKTWYKNLGISYNLNAKNILSGPDSLLFSNISENIKNGIKHSIPISTSFNILKYLNINPAIRYNESWFFKKENTQEPMSTDTTGGFWSIRDIQLSTQISTKIYGFVSTKKKKFRHVFTPSFGYSYKPDWSQEEFEHLIGVYSTSNAAKQSRFNLNLSNNFEMKIEKEGEEKKIKLIDNLSISGYYDNILDSFKMSKININLRTKLFNKIDFKASSSIDPYALSPDTVRINEFLFNSGKIGRLTNMNFDIGVNLNNKSTDKNSDFGTQEQLDYINQNIDHFVDFNVPWSLRLYYNLAYRKPLIEPEITQSINFNGDLNITKKWKIGFRSGYDLKNQDFTYTSIDLYRDLHCWEMTFNWIPLGFHKSYNFVIKVKSAILQDLKLTKKRGIYDY